MTTLCLNMIVKNEAHIIRRCLLSVKPYVDAWLIVDTGSDDDTAVVIQETMADLPGRVEHRPWVNFGHNRAEALELAKPMADYTLVVDADEVMETPDGFEMPPLTAGVYYVTIANQHRHGFRFIRPQIFRNSLPWTYRGVLHEAAVCDAAYEEGRIEEIVLRGHFDGARNQVSEVRKYSLDALTLERALLDEPDNGRYQFYLAQSYRDSEQLDRAVAAYKKRVAMGGWEQEVFYALFQIAEIAAAKGDATPAEVMALYFTAYERRPSRAEPLHSLARYLRERRQFATAALIAERAMALPMSDDALFVDRSVYEWRAADEFAVSSYWAGDRARAAEAARKVLATPTLPEAERPRIEENLRFCEADADA